MLDFLNIDFRIGFILAGLLFVMFYAAFNKKNVGSLDGYFLIIIGIIACIVMS